MLPREKFSQKGVEALSDSELIAIIVGSGCKSSTFIQISRKILRKLRKDIEDRELLKTKNFSEIEGVGEVTAMRIIAGIELGRRVYLPEQSERKVLRNSKQAYLYLEDIKKYRQENMIGVFLNARFEVLGKKTIVIGSVDRVNVIPRDIIIPALELNASSVIIAHNHPSGESTPSEEDILVTKNIKKSLDLVGIQLLEHLVIAKDGWSTVEI